MLVNCLAVGCGGFIGSILRYLITWVPIGKDWPLPVGTLVTNVVGSFAIGWVAATWARQASLRIPDAPGGGGVALGPLLHLRQRRVLHRRRPRWREPRWGHAGLARKRARHAGTMALVVGMFAASSLVVVEGFSASPLTVAESRVLCTGRSLTLVRAVGAMLGEGCGSDRSHRRTLLFSFYVLPPLCRESWRSLLSFCVLLPQSGAHKRSRAGSRRQNPSWLTFGRAPRVRLPRSAGLLSTQKPSWPLPVPMHGGSKSPILSTQPRNSRHRARCRGQIP